jgi:hypothetical protein
MKYEPTGAHTLEEFLYWGLQQRAAHGATEAKWKLRGYETLEKARQALLAGDQSWSKLMFTALTSTGSGALGGLGSLVSWQMVDSFGKWLKQNEDRAAALLRGLWSPSAAWPDAMGPLLHELASVQPGPGSRLRLVATLAAVTDPERRPPYKARAFAKAYKLAGEPAAPSNDPLDAYRHAVDFLDRLAATAAAHGESLTRLEAHDLVWYVVGYGPAGAWPPSRRKVFAEFRGDPPPYGSLAEQSNSEMATLAVAMEDEEGPEDEAEARERVLRAILARRGQAKFRNALMEAYGHQCAITGPAHDAVLEAAHIHPVADGGGDDVTNGLLLRSDVHTLFDVGLLAIDEKTWTVILADGLRGDGGCYAELHERPVKLPAEAGKQPSADAIAQHRSQCRF